MFEELQTQAPVPPALRQRFRQLDQLVARLAQSATGRSDLPYWVADDFLQAVALTLLDWAGTRLDAASASRWEGPSRAMHTWILPEFDMRVQIIERRLDETEHAADPPTVA